MQREVNRAEMSLYQQCKVTEVDKRTRPPARVDQQGSIGYSCADLWLWKKWTKGIPASFVATAEVWGVALGSGACDMGGTTPWS